MRLYYTNSPKPNQPQLDANKSLGGYISSSIIPNDIKHSLFSEASYYTLKNRYTQIRCFALKNTNGSGIENITLSFKFNEDNLFNYYIIVSQPTQDECGDVFELIQNDFSSPYEGTFEEIIDEQILSLDSIVLADGEVVGLWLKRVLKETSTLEKTCSQLESEYTTPPAKLDTIEITITYDIQESGSSSSGSTSGSGSSSLS